MPGERRPRRWATGSAGGSSESPSSTRRISPAASPARNLAPQQQRWGSSLSTQRRERAVVWASCLQKVQALRQGGSWQRAESGPRTNAASTASTGVGGGDGGAGPGVGAAAQDQQRAVDELNEQLDILIALAYPNSSISHQDAGFMISALCEAVPRGAGRLSAKVAQLYVSLCAKQQKVTFLAWQLNIVLDLLVRSLAPAAAAAAAAAAVTESSTPPPPLSPSSLPSPWDRRDCARALAQLLYENGERLGTRFDDLLPPLLGLADPSAVDLEMKHAALDALANLSLKNWPGFTEQQRQAVCSCLTQNFVKHWRAFSPCPPTRAAAPASATTAPTAIAVPSAITGGGGVAERKVLASATRGLGCAVSKSGAAAVLEPYLARVVHALNHLVQPAEGAEKAAAAARGTAGGGGSSSTSGSRSRSRSSKGFGGHVGGGGGGGGGGGSGSCGVSPTRSSASASLSDPRARVRLQALTLLESMAAKDAKSLHPHWVLFFAPYAPGTAHGGSGRGDETAAASDVQPGGSNPVLPAGLLSILENDYAPQVRAAAAGAAASLVKNAPLRKWMLLLPPPASSAGTATLSGGGGGGMVGIGERVESMMVRLHRSLVGCLAREKSPAVLAKLCACSGALVAEMPYAAVVPRGGSGGGSCPGGRAGVEESLGDLLRALARLAMDVAAEPSARIAASQALTAAFSMKEPIAAIDSFLLNFRCAVGVRGGSGGGGGGASTPPLPSSPPSAALAAARGSSSSSSSIISTPGAGLGGWSPLPLRPGSADDRGNRFVAGGARNGIGIDTVVQRRQQQQHQLRPSPSPLRKREGSREAGDGAGGGGRSAGTRGGPEQAGSRGGGGQGGGEVANAQIARVSDLDQMPPPLPRVKVVIDDDDDDAASAPAPASSASSGAGNRSGESFVDHLIALAGAPGQLRAEALGLLTRIGRSYPAHLSGGGGSSGTGTGAPKTTWERVSALLLRCFADPDQNLRLHALKVLEALLLARAEQAAAATAARAKGTAAAAAAPAPAAENMSPHHPTRCRSQDKGKQAAAWGDGGATGGSPDENDREGEAPSHQATVCRGGYQPEVGGGSETEAEGDGGSKLWEDLVQKHLQRALEDPYHGVRAVACSCHACLLDSDWGAFSDRERDRCLDSVLAATRDRAAGVNILACRVVAGVMTMAGQDGTAKWCREPEFLARCAARLEEMMEDPKATIRAQAMLAVGNLSCSLHGIRSRQQSLSTSLHALDHSRPSASCGSSEPLMPGQAAACRVTPEELVPRPRLRSLCNGALRLTATEPDHAAGSAVRALGYLAWGLDPANIGSGGGGGGFRRGSGGGDEDCGSGGRGERYANGSVVSSSPGRGRGGGEAVADDAQAAGADTAAAEAAAAAARGRRCGEEGAREGREDGRDAEDRDLQDKAVLTLSTRLAPEKESLSPGAGGGGARGGGGDRRAEIAAAKCRWNCCIALGVVLSAPGVQARVSEAAWAPDLMRSLRRSVVEDGHLKVRTHAAHALRTVRDARQAYGDQLPAILGGALRGFRACKQRSIAADPTQMRYIADLEAALLSLVLHTLIALVLGGNDASTAGDPATTAAAPAGGSATTALLVDYADELLELLSFPEADAALRISELLPYYYHRCRQSEAYIMLAADGDRRRGGDGGRSEGDKEGLRRGADDTSCSSPRKRLQEQQRQQQSGSPSLALLQAETVLASIAEGLVRLFARADGADGDSGGCETGGGGVGDGGGCRANEQLLLVSKQTWAACVAEAGRRRRSVARILGEEGAGRGGRYGAEAASGSGGVGVVVKGTEAEEEEGDGEM
eukprot:g14050.t1